MHSTNVSLDDLMGLVNRKNANFSLNGCFAFVKALSASVRMKGIYEKSIRTRGAEIQVIEA